LGACGREPIYPHALRFFFEEVLGKKGVVNLKPPKQEKKIPELMRGIGKGVKEFKDGVNGLDTEIDDKNKTKEKTETK
jgi:hypothetical protein